VKKLIAVLLCVFTFAGTALVYPVYHYLLSEVKLQAQLLMHSTISPDELVTLRIANKDAGQQNGFIKTGEDEIQFHGRMYDVVTMSRHNDTLQYVCISDYNEDMLNTIFARAFNVTADHSPVPDNTQKTIVPNCIRDFLVCTKLHVTYSPLIAHSSGHYQFSIPAPESGDVLYSPPEIV
jgi:hypothetical protein